MGTNIALSLPSVLCADTTGGVSLVALLKAVTLSTISKPTLIPLAVFLTTLSLLDIQYKESSACSLKTQFRNNYAWILKKIAPKQTSTFMAFFNELLKSLHICIYLFTCVFVCLLYPKESFLRNRDLAFAYTHFPMPRTVPGIQKVLIVAE